MSFNDKSIFMFLKSTKVFEKFSFQTQSKMEQLLVSAAQQLEKQLDSEIGRLDNLGADDLEAIRERRLKEMKQRQEKIIQWKQNVKEENTMSNQNVFLTETFLVLVLGTWRIFRASR